MRLYLYILSASLAFGQSQSELKIIPKQDDSATGIIKFQEKYGSGLNYVGVRAPSSIPANVTWTLPSADGTSGQCLQTDGSGQWGWAACSSTLPVVDTTGIAKGSSDASKLLRFEVDGFTTATTRVLTPPNANATIAGLEVQQSFTAPQTVAIASVQNQMTLAQTNNTGTYDPACLVLASTNTSTTTVYGAARVCAGYETASFTDEKFAIQTATGSGTYQDAITVKNQVVTVAGDLVATAGTYSFNSGTMDGTMKPLFSGNGSIGSASYRYGNGYFSAADITAAGFTLSDTTTAGYVWTATSSGGAGAWQAPSASAILPVADTQTVIKGSSDATKIVRFEVDGFTSGATRVLTPPNANATIAGLEVQQSFTAPQTVAIASVQNQMTLAQTNATGAYDPACLTVAATNTVGSTVYGAGRLCGGYESASFTNEKVAIQTATGSGAYQDVVTFKNQVATFAGDITATIGTFSFSSGTMAGTMKPLFNSTGKIGDTSYYYANGYFTTADIGTIEAATAYKMGGTTVINSSRNMVGLNAFAQSILFSAGSTYNVGSTGAPPLNVYGNYIEPLTELVMGSGVSFRGSLIPATNNTYAIGNTSFRLSTVVTTNFNVSGTVTAPNGNTGLSSIRTVGDGSGGSCTITISGGIITASTCP